MATNLLLLLTIASVFVGVALGVGLREAHPGRLAQELIALPGEIFLRMLKMLILPLIVFSLIAGLGSLDAKVGNTLFGSCCSYFMGCVCVCVCEGGGGGLKYEVLVSHSQITSSLQPPKWSGHDCFCCFSVVVT